MKKCKSCQKEIDEKAKKCPYCQTDQRNWFARHPILTVILGIFLLGMIGSAGGSKGTKPTANTETTTSNPTATPTPTKNTKKLQIGDTGFIRFEGATEGQVVILGVTKADQEEVMKAMLANDNEGLLELATQNKAFGVGVGTKAKIIDSAVGVRRVRIVETFRKVDTDKVGLTGWLPMEFIVAE